MLNATRLYLQRLRGSASSAVHARSLVSLRTTRLAVLIIVSEGRTWEGASENCVSLRLRVTLSLSTTHTPPLRTRQVLRARAVPYELSTTSTLACS
jgi:hypothetical protein